MEAPAAHSLPADIRVAIADDEPLFVEMVRALLSAEDGIDVVATAGDGRRAVQVAAEYNPDVILMDVSMPVMDGIEATRRIKAQNGDACVLILTGATTPEDVDRARQAGAAAYVTKDRIASDLVAEIRSLAAR
jgi:DNA-binding NarL/FixJ family response regulator